MDILSAIIEFETGQLDDEGFVTLFAELVKTGQAWTLQGSYGRTAKALISEGVIDHQGNILWPESA